MITQLLLSVRAMFVFTLLCGLIYPLAMTGIAQGLFAPKANGSLIASGGKVIGSELLAQKFTETRYFWPRPSAADFATVASGASNQGFTSKKLLNAVIDRRQALGAGAPADLLYASGSGLDPHTSPEAAYFQAPRIAAARALPLDRIEQIIRQHIEHPQWGFLGQTRVNVLLLNLTLDQEK